MKKKKSIKLPILWLVSYNLFREAIAAIRYEAYGSHSGTVNRVNDHDKFDCSAAFKRESQTDHQFVEPKTHE